MGIHAVINASHIVGCYPPARGVGRAKYWCEKAPGAERCLRGFITVPEHIKGVNIKERRWLYRMGPRGVTRGNGVELRVEILADYKEKSS